MCFFNVIKNILILIVSSYIFLLTNGQDFPKASVVTQLLEDSKYLLERAIKLTAEETGWHDHLDNKPMDCSAIFKGNPCAQSGLYQIWPRNRIIEGSINVYCDMEDDGGGWTVIQRRGDFGSDEDYFYKNWTEYKYGFGDLEKDFWLGNDNIFALTNQRTNIVKFVLSDWEGNTSYATYDEFWIYDEKLKYLLYASGYKGTAYDSLWLQVGSPFSTKDRDNDASGSSSCAEKYRGAWWYYKCYFSNLNGIYYKGKKESHDGVTWRSFKGYYSLKDVVIKIRDKRFFE